MRVVKPRPRPCLAVLSNSGGRSAYAGAMLILILNFETSTATRLGNRHSLDHLHELVTLPRTVWQLLIYTLMLSGSGFASAQLAANPWKSRTLRFGSTRFRVGWHWS